jgi:general secretion pathway protein H
MVVIVIIGILAGAAVLAIPEAGGGLRTEAERFAARAKAAQEAAVVNGRSTALRVEPAGYALAERRHGTWRDIGVFPWERGTAPEIAPGAAPRTVFDATGLADPLEIVLRRQNERVQIVIGSDGEINVRR